MSWYHYTYGRTLTAEQSKGASPRTPQQEAVAKFWTAGERSRILRSILNSRLEAFARDNLRGDLLASAEMAGPWSVLDVLCDPEGAWLWTFGSKRGATQATAATNKRKAEVAAALAGALERFDAAMRQRAQRWAQNAHASIPEQAGPRTRWLMELLQHTVQQVPEPLIAAAEMHAWETPFRDGAGEAQLKTDNTRLADCQNRSTTSAVMRLWPAPGGMRVEVDPACGEHHATPKACPVCVEFPAALLAWMWPQLDKPTSSAALERAVAACFRPRWEEALALLTGSAQPDPSAQPPPLVWRIRSLLATGFGPIEPGLLSFTKNGIRKWNRATPAKLAEYGHWREEDQALQDRLKSLGLDKRALRLDPLILHNVLLPLVGKTNLVDADAAPIQLQLGRPELRVEVLPDASTWAQVLLPNGEQMEKRSTYSPPAAEITQVAATGITWITPWTDELDRLVEATSVSRGVFPPEATAQLTERLTQLSAAVSVSLPEALRGTELPPDTRLRIRLDFAVETGLGLQLRVEPLSGAALHPPGEGPAQLQGSQHGKPVWTQRDLDAEVDAVVELLPHLPDLGEEVAPFSWRIADIELAVDALAALDPPPPGTLLQWQDPARRRHVRTAHSKAALQLELTSKRDWFQLDGKLRAGELEVPVERVLHALREGKRYVEVADGGILRLADEVRRLLQPLSDAADVDKRGVHVSPLAAGLLRELPLDKSPPQPWANALLRWREAQDLQPAIPAELRAELRPYQVAGVQWLLRLAHWAPGAVLADDMGLGKTVQTLAVLLAHRHLGPQLVVAPLSLLHNWQQEAAKFAPTLQVRQLHELDVLHDIQAGQVVVASWDRMVRRAEELRAIAWTTLVLDEAQQAKNAQTQRAKAASDLPRAFCIALTGTPVENRTSELWSLFSLTVPGLLGGWAWFRDEFATPIESRRDKAVRARLTRRIGPFLLRRLKREVAPDLPEKTEVQLDITLSDEERALYLAHRGAIVRLLAEEKQLPPEQRRMQVLAGLTRLRQLACHPQLVEPDCGLSSAKLQVLLERLIALREEGHRALVFSQFVRHLALVRTELERAGLRIRYLDGQTPAAQRRSEVEAFQSGDGDVFLISLKAGGTGLNLTAASYVFHLDPWWNPAVEDQATDRTHRIGQAQPVTVYRLVAEATVESQILQLHADKRALVSDLLEGTGGAALATADLEALLLGA